ncbi:MAG: serine/threonine protein kinase, partial [Acidobacteria bacterium]
MTTWIGQTLGRYRIVDRIGRGGMAEVYRATDDRLRREVAIKIIQPDIAQDPDARARFLREARVIASLEHPHVLPIYDLGEHRTDDGTVPFLVMPLVRGGSLADRLHGAPLPPERVVPWVEALAGALDAAHQAGVLHRDVKPANVLVGTHEHLYLADFGIARLAAATTHLTRTGTVIGTPVYMAPEVAAGSAAEAPADRYALAVMAYELLTGRPPFEGENVLSVLHQHATRPVPPASRRATHLPAEVDRALAAGMAKRPQERPASCRLFVAALAAALGHQPVATQAVTPPPAPADAAPTATYTPPGVAGAATHKLPPVTTRPLARGRRRWGVAAALAAVLVVAAALALSKAGREAPPP